MNTGVISFYAELTHVGRVWIETNVQEASDLVPSPPCFDVLEASTGTMRRISLHPFMARIYWAATELVLAGLPVERVTVINGEVAAHPSAKDHHRCPFCYPSTESLWGPIDYTTARRGSAP